MMASSCNQNQKIIMSNEKIGKCWMYNTSTGIPKDYFTLDIILGIHPFPMTLFRILFTEA